MTIDRFERRNVKAKHFKYMQVILHRRPCFRVSDNFKEIVYLKVLQ